MMEQYSVDGCHVFSAFYRDDENKWKKYEIMVAAVIMQRVCIFSAKYSVADSC